MSQYFWSHAEPHSLTQNKGWDAALMVKLEKTLFFIDGDTRLFAQWEHSYRRPLSMHRYTGVISLIFSWRKMSISVYVTETLIQLY